MPGALAEESPLTEEAFEQLLDYPSTRLAVYGSLGPGEQNHWVLEDLVGEWSLGSVRGVLHARGWGASDGFPGMEWIPTAGEIPLLVFISHDLPRHWGRIDAFEGEDYRRILIPVDLATGALVVANIYEVRGES
ncbi:MAG: gamma-glutamylcyclotransferase [Gemmatimonadota bacterium]|nr:MAG: gamma-glutamylcyclotransferase [Gemmatimonadota bacterium]